MNSNLLIGLIFAGIIQGFFLGIFILTSKRHRSKAATYLGLLILCFTISNLQYTLDDLDLISWHLFNLLYLPYLFLAGPFLYFFVSYFLHPKIRPKKIELLFYIPALVVLVMTLLYKGITIVSQKTYDTDPFLEQIADIIDYYGDFVNIFTFLIVITFLFVKIFRQQKKPRQQNKNIVSHELLWLKVLLGILLAVLIPWSYFTYQYYQNESFFYLPMFAVTSLIIYLIGYIGIHKVGVLNDRNKIRKYVHSRSSYSIVEKTQNEHISKIENIVLKGQRYLDSNFSLESLAEELQLSKSHLSRIINNELGTSFSDYLNTLRVEEAKKHLQNPDFSNYTLVSIGLESGFNSKTTFNTTFKKFTGLTPSQYKKSKAN